MRTVGIIGGMGWEGSAAYYRVMNRAVRARLGGLHSARVLLDSLQFETIAGAQQRRDAGLIQAELVASAQRLERAGAALLVIACNTVHRFAAQVQAAVSVPLLHIADPVGDAAAADGHRRVGLLGTRATTEGRFYADRLAEAHGLQVVAPAAPTRRALHTMILQELAAGDNPTACADRLDSVVRELADQGCTAVLLACTEFGLAYGASDTPCLHRDLPLYDTATLHALAAVDRALAPQ